MFLLSAIQMREIDRVTIAEHGIPGTQLMAHAAAAVEARIERDFPHAMAGTIAILGGGGNNGGDGLVLARRLAARRVRVRALLFAPPGRLRGDAAAAWTALTDKPAQVLSEADWHGQRAAVFAADLVVDALFGTGLVRPLSGWIRGVVEDLNRDHRGPVLSVDMPSGLSSDADGPAEAADAAVVRATATVTFTAPKLGHYLSAHADCVGALTVAAIGTPEAVVADAGSCCRVTVPAEIAPCFAPRAPAAHKGNFGHVGVIAGSRGKSGAAVLAGTAALRSGAGLVTVAVPRSILPIVAGARPELMTEPLPETAVGSLAASAVDAIEQQLRAATVLALGPGLSQTPETSEAVRAIVSACRRPCVLDADGLNAFAGHRDQLHLPGGVLTPHPGEMARLFAATTAEVEARRLYFAQRLAAETGALAVLKGHRTLVADPDGNTWVNCTGNPGMATGGAGDVLTGMIAGLLAQHTTAPLAPIVAAAVYLHGLAGDVAARRLGQIPLLAGDILSEIPEAIREVRRGRN